MGMKRWFVKSFVGVWGLSEKKHFFARCLDAVARVSIIRAAGGAKPP